MTKRLAWLLPNLLATFARFPVASIAALATCVAVNADIHNFDGQNFGYAMLMDHGLAGAAAFLAAGALELWSEARGSISRLFAILIAAALALIVAIASYFERQFSASDLFLILGLILTLMVAPYLRRGVRQASFWNYNMNLWVAALLAFVVAIILAASVSAVVASLESLLGFDFSNSIYENIWWTAATLFAPLYGLSLVPHDLDREINIGEHKGTLLERGISILVSYILSPLTIVYAVILHVYAAQQVLGLKGGNLNLKDVGIIVSSFTFAGTISWLVGWPWRETGNWLLRIFMRFWFVLLIVPLGLLSYAAVTRIADAGVTPSRYGLVVVAVWILVMLIYVAVRRGAADMRIVVSSVAALLLFGSFGPQGATSISINSQFSRLSALLERTAVVVGGRLAKPRPTLSLDDQKVGQGLVEGLASADGLYRLSPYFEGDKAKQTELEAKHAYYSSWSIMGDFGLNASLAGMVNFHSVAPADFALTKYRIIGPINYYSNMETKRLELPTDVVFKIENQNISVSIAGHQEQVPVQSVLKKLKDANSPGVGTDSHQPPLTLEMEGRFSIFVIYANGSEENGGSVSNMNFWILEKQE